GEGEEPVVVQVTLVAEEHDEVVEPGAADLGDDVGVTEVAGEVDAADLGAERPGDRRHRETSVLTDLQVARHGAASCRSMAGRSTLRTLPEAVRGKSATRRSSSGHFWRAIPAVSRCAVRSANVSSAASGCRRTTAQACSPRRASGAATTATSATVGIAITAFS